MITKEFDDLYLLHPIYPAMFERYIYDVAGVLSQHDEQPYDGGYWKSTPIGSGWFFELQNERSWHIINENNYADENPIYYIVLAFRLPYCPLLVLILLTRKC